MLKQLILLILLLPTTVFASGVSVFVSVPPLQYLAERIGGNLIMVESMVGPGHNPVSYDPGPGQVHRLADAVLFVRTGIPYEDVWMGRLIQVNPRMQVLDARLNLPVASESVHHHDGHELDPHVWTSLPNAIAIARNIANSLSEFDSGNSSRYRANFDKLEKELEDQHRRIGAMLGDVSRRRSSR